MKVTILIITNEQNAPRFSNYHLNGYQKETSPFLDKTENLLSFQNVYAGANLTLLSLPQIITRTHPHNKNIQYEEKSIVMPR